MKLKLNDIEKKNPFSVEKDYFEKLPLKIQQQTFQKSETSITKSFSLSWKIAMAIFPILFIIGVVFYNGQKSTNEDLLTGITNEEIIAYLEVSEVTIDDLKLMVDLAEEEEIMDDSSFDLDLDDQSIEEIYLEYDIINEI